MPFQSESFTFHTVAGTKSHSNFKRHQKILENFIFQMVRFLRIRISKILFIVFFITVIYITLVGLDLLKMSVTKIDSKSLDCDDGENNVKSKEMKYILLWTGGKDIPFLYFGTGNKVFLSRRCKWTNCYVTSNREFFVNYAEFEVLLFNAPRLPEIAYRDIPRRRHMRQKYVFASIEAASNYPITGYWNGFFNWTWTYKLDSDALWGYFAIRNATKHIIGPSKNMHWMKLSDMTPINDEKKLRLNSKTKAAAWFSSNCDTSSEREHLVTEIRVELRKYGLDVDIYGSCGVLRCPKEMMDSCLRVLENKYYFYFVFENAVSEDYVSEKLLHALLHNTVPVVYGGANYSRFMPEGIYLDALKMKPKQLARKMHEVITYRDLYYYDFFKWQNHYSYHFRGESPETDDYCNFCAVINNDNKLMTTTIYDRMSSWWNPHFVFTYKQAHEVIDNQNEAGGK